MAIRPVQLRLNHIIGAIDEATDYLDGKDFAGYQGSRIARRAIERCLTIVSEAARHIPASQTERYPDIPWRAVSDIGNVLRHRYYAVSDHVVWRTATYSLPELRPVVLSMLAAADMERDETSKDEP